MSIMKSSRKSSNQVDQHTIRLIKIISGCIVTGKIKLIGKESSKWFTDKFNSSIRTNKINDPSFVFAMEYVINIIKKEFLSMS